MTEKRKRGKKQDDLLFIPDACCPEGGRQPGIPAPRSCLGGEELAVVEQKIREANRLLLKLTNDCEEQTRNGLSELFAGLIDVEICISHTEGEAYDRTGIVKLAGRDFVLLETNKKKTAIPYEKIKEIKAPDPEERDGGECETLTYDPFLRRCLAYHFGETVACNPELVHLFFRLRLNAFMMQFIDRRVDVFANGERVKGELYKVDQDSLEICHADDMRKTIPLRRLSLVSIH